MVDLCYSQARPLIGEGDLKQFYTTLNFLQTTEIRASNSLFYRDEFATGEICFVGGTCFENVSFRVDVQNRIFEFDLGDRHGVMYADNRIVQQYRYKDDRFAKEVFITHKKSTRLPYSNYRIVGEDKSFVLLEEFYVNDEKVSTTNVPGMEDHDMKKDLKTRYFVVLDSIPKEIKRTLSFLSDSFDCDKKRLKSFVKKSGIKIKDDDGFKRLVAYSLSCFDKQNIHDLGNTNSHESRGF
ncbi:MAG: hypothetical protein Tsb0034_27570 [Ekhidna sp.]